LNPQLSLPSTPTYLMWFDSLSLSDVHAGKCNMEWSSVNCGQLMFLSEIYRRGGPHCEFY
jgi:hypothetical protein